MKKIKKFFVLLTLNLMFLCVSNIICTPSIETVNAATIKLNKSKIVLLTKQSYRLKLTGTNVKIKWKSSDARVATVSSTGKVYAKISGSTTITASVGNRKYKCIVKVEDPFIGAISDRYGTFELPNEIDMMVDEKLQLKIRNTTQKTKWSSSNSNIVSVDKNGLIVAKKDGSAKITATILGKKFTKKIIVCKRFYPSKEDIYFERLGESTTINIICNPLKYDNGSIHYMIEDPSIVSCEFGNNRLDNGGHNLLWPLTITSKKVGITKIQITCKDENGIELGCFYINVVCQKPNVADNLENLKNYITTYGFTNNENNKVIKFTMDDNSAVFAIIYEADKNRFNLIQFTYTNGQASSSLNLYLSLNNEYAPTEYLVSYGGAYGLARTTLDIGSYYKDKVVGFDVIKTNALPYKIKNLANHALSSAVSGWDYLLKKECNMSVRDIGFESYY